MGRKDTLAKRYMKKPEIFADFFNGYIYNGESVVKADLLQEVDTSGIGMIRCSKDNDKRLSIQKYRDIIIEAVAYDSLSVKDVGTWTVLQQNRAKKL